MDRLILIVIASAIISMTMTLSGCFDRTFLMAREARIKAGEVCNKPDNIITKDSCWTAYNYCVDDGMERSRCLDLITNTFGGKYEITN